MKLSVPKKIILIGASTGGPGQIQKIIDSIPKLHNTSVIIAQHMVEGFIESFAKRLQSTTQNHISVIQDNQIFKNSHIYLCEGSTQINRDSYALKFSHKAVEYNSFNPDINLLFNSFIPLSKDADILSVILTGIGDDGVNACRELSLNGAKCITESQKSAIVDGMPSRARLLVPDVEVLDIESIIKAISEFCE